MKQKKRRVKLFNPLTEIIEKTLSKLKYDLTSCPLPSDIDDLSQSIFNSLLDTIPIIDPDTPLDVKQPIKPQIINKMKNNNSENQNGNELSFDNFWAEWLKFRASIWSLSSISVVDDIYQSYIKERIDELKIIIENVESKEQLTSPNIKHEFTQIRYLVDKAFLNLQSIVIDQIAYTEDYEEEDYNNINPKKEKERIESLMSHRTQIRRIKDDFSTRYKNFFQLNNQERSIADVQHRRCISIIEEILIALNKLRKQQENFDSLKEELYIAEEMLINNIIPSSANIPVVRIYKSQNDNFVLPEDAESVNAELIINNLISSRSNSPFNSPLNSPNKVDNSKQPHSPNNEKNSPGNDNFVTPVKNTERKWKTPEPQAPPAVIQPLNLHELSGMPDSFKDLSKRFNTSDSDYLSTPSSPDPKQRRHNNQKETPKKTILNNCSQKNQNKTKQVVFIKDQNQANQKEKPNNNLVQSSIKQQQQNRLEEADSTNQTENSDNSKQPNNENENDDKGSSLSTSSYTSDDEEAASLSRSSRLAAILSPSESNKDKSKEEDKVDSKESAPTKSKDKVAGKVDKKKKNGDPEILRQQQLQQKKQQKQKESISGRFDSTFLRPKRKSSDYEISASSSIFSSSSKLNHSLDNINNKPKKKNKDKKSKKTKNSKQPSTEIHMSSSSAPSSPSLIPADSSFTSQSVMSPSHSSPVIKINKDLMSSQNVDEFVAEEEEIDDRDELTRLKDDYETLLVQLNVYSEENKELQIANEEIPFLKKKIDFYEELEIFYEDEIQRLYQTIISLSKRINKKTKDESIYLENSRLHREKDQLFSKLQNVQKEIQSITSKSRSSNELLIMLREEREKNDKLKLQINELQEKVQNKNNSNESIDEEVFIDRKEKFVKESETVKQQIKIQNLNLKILHLKSKIKRYKIRLSHNEPSQSKERKEIEKLENEIAAIRNSFESIQDLRFNQQDELFKEQTKNDFLQTTIEKLNEKIENPAFDIESGVMNELKDKIQENRNLKEENEKVKSTLFELYHLICGEALTDNVDDVTILLDGIRQHLA